MALPVPKVADEAQQQNNEALDKALEALKAQVKDLKDRVEALEP